MVGTDQGLLEKPVPVTKLDLAPAERVDLVVDFRSAAGREVVLKSVIFDLVQFRVAGGSPSPAIALPAELRPVARTAPSSATMKRLLTLGDRHDPKTGTMVMLLGWKRWKDPVTEQPELGSTETWTLMNLADEMHPIHLHGVRFQILDRQGFDAETALRTGKVIPNGAAFAPSPWEDGWKDTVQVPPGTLTRIIVRFDGYKGRYVWHCHVLEHAANEMMRPFEVVEPGKGGASREG